MTSAPFPQTTSAGPPPPDAAAAVPDAAKGRRVRPLRKPWQWVATIVVVVLVLNFGQTLFTNKAWDWPRVGYWVLHPAILTGLLITVQVTVLSAIISFVAGTVVALARGSRNRVLRSAAWLYIWLFRSVPLILILVFLYNLPLLYKAIGIGIPFGPQLEVPTTTVLSDLLIGVVGLSLSQTAYSAEVVRSGLLAVDTGQHEAAKALGLPQRRQFTRIVLPQALRTIVPSYVNQIIDLTKSSSLLFYVSVLDLFGVVQNLQSTFPTDVIPLLVVASLWYLVLTGVVSIVQFSVERFYNRGVRGSR